MFLEAQEFLLQRPRLRGQACPAPDTLNKFVFLEPEWEWLGVGISRPPIKSAAGLGQVPSFLQLPALSPGWLPTMGQGPGVRREGANSFALGLVFLLSPVGNKP